MLVSNQANVQTFTDLTIYFEKTTRMLAKKSPIDPETQIQLFWNELNML